MCTVPCDICDSDTRILSGMPSMQWMRPDTPHLQQKEAEEMERVLKECTKELQQKDSILEPTTARTLEQFVQVGGTLEDAVDLMVGSFADLPTSLNKMMELLHLSGTLCHIMGGVGPLAPPNMLQL